MLDLKLIFQTRQKTADAVSNNLMIERFLPISPSEKWANYFLQQKKRARSFLFD